MNIRIVEFEEKASEITIIASKGNFKKAYAELKELAKTAEEESDKDTKKSMEGILKDTARNIKRRVDSQVIDNEVMMAMKWVLGGTIAFMVFIGLLCVIAEE